MAANNHVCTYAHEMQGHLTCLHRYCNQQKVKTLILLTEAIIKLPHHKQPA